MKKITLASILVGFTISLYATDISSAIDELHTLTSSFKHKIEHCHYGSGYLAGVSRNACLKANCTMILGSISNTYYGKFDEYYDTCKHSSTLTCKKYIKAYENAYINIDKVCQRHIISF